MSKSLAAAVIILLIVGGSIYLQTNHINPFTYLPQPPEPNNFPNQPQLSTTTPRNFNEQTAAQLIHQETNRERTSRSLTALTWSPRLAEAAQEKAEEMAQLGYFSHNSPTGVTLAERLQAHGMNNLGAGENLYLTYYDPTETELATETVQAWINSPGHATNLLYPAFWYEGVGVARQGDETYVVAIYKTAAFLPNP